MVSYCLHLLNYHCEKQKREGGREREGEGERENKMWISESGMQDKLMNVAFFKMFWKTDSAGLQTDAADCGTDRWRFHALLGKSAIAALSTTIPFRFNVSWKCTQTFFT